MTHSEATGAARTPEQPVKHVCFRLHDQEFAVDIAAVKETMAVRPITRVFLTPPYFAGIINLRGDIVAVLDLALLLGLPATDIDRNTRIVICQHPAASTAARTAAAESAPAQLDGIVAGVLADELTELRALDLSRIEPPPPTLPEQTATLLRGMTNVGAMLLVLDMAALFRSDRVRAFQREAI